MNLATIVHKVTSVADCFHFKYCINKLLCLALAGKLRYAKSELSKASATNAADRLVTAADEYAQIQFYTDLYVESMSNISQCIHPFFQGNKKNTSKRAEDKINIELQSINQVIEECQIRDNYKLFSKARQQVPDMVAVIDQWNLIKDEMISRMKLEHTMAKWFDEYLLPKTYWETMTGRTKHGPTRSIYKTELQRLEQYNTFGGQERCLPGCIIEKLRQQAVDICRKFQRASSQVEGRNGFLSAINHNQRSFDCQRLEVLTVVHNFDTKGADGLVPADRLFGKFVSFDSLFEYIIDNFGEIPNNRTRKSKQTNNQCCPTLDG